MFKKNLFTSLTSLLIIISVTLGASIVHIELAYAAALTTLSDTQSSVKVSALSDHTINFVTPTGVAAGQTITITFPNGWNLGNLATTSFDFATSTSASCASVADAPLANTAVGTTWGVSTTTSVITFTSNTAVVAPNRCIQIRIGSNATFQGTGSTTITNPSSATSSIISIGGTFGDTGIITTNIITDDTVSMTGTVSQSISFTISTTTIYFGTLGSGAAKFASSTATTGDTVENVAHSLGVSTNAPSGYTISIRGQTLTSQQNASNTISAIGISPLPSSIGTEQFGIRATVTGGTGATVDPTYASTTAYGYNATATTSAAFATGTGATNISTYSLRYIANIAGLTEAGTYVANMVFVTTANF